VLPRNVAISYISSFPVTKVYKKVYKSFLWKTFFVSYGLHSILWKMFCPFVWSQRFL